MIDASLIRWINASVNTAFAAAAPPYALYVAGQEINVIDPSISAWAELHFSSGPNIVELTKNHFEADLLLTVMCTTVYTDDDYLIHKITGQFLGLMSAPILTYKYGNLSGDDSSYIGCLQPQKKARVHAWGAMQIDGAKAGPIRVKAQSIEQEFLMCF